MYPQRFTGRLKFFQIDRWIHPHPSRPLHQRLHNHSSGRIGVFTQCFFHRLKTFGVTAFSLQSIGTAKTIRPLHRQMVSKNLFKLAPENFQTTDRKRTQCFTMVPSVEVSKPYLLGFAFLLPVLQTHFQSHFHRRGTIIRKKYFLKFRW